MTLDYGTLREDRTDFNADAVTQRRHRARDFDRFVQGLGLEHEITAHCFFGFRERPVDDEPAVRARDHPALAAERLRAFDFAALVESLEPSNYFVHGLF